MGQWLAVGRWNFADSVTAAIVLDDLEAGDGFAFGVFDGEAGVFFGPVIEFEEGVFARAGTEEHGMVFMGTVDGLNVEVVKGVGVGVARQTVADE